ncbi:seryl-tRNA synthetase [Irpex rosettiformis]|uniref:Seryl-tRNA synthetase n=1 Tax=Irpex rosettiformis TaxID=378272 RepID=A0ACB8UIV4_9APHY|nr:seryl-tRNA synthetase [Irpex rosettiformis]
MYSVRFISSKANSSGLPRPRLNYRDITENSIYKSHNAFNRKAALPVGALPKISKLYEDQKTLSSTLNVKRHEQSQMGARIKQVAKDAQAKQAALQEAKSLKAEISGLENKLTEVDAELFRLALAVPNDTHPDVPIGPESAAVTLTTHGPATVPGSPSRDHVAIGKQLGLLDFEAAAAVTGSSWYYLLNEGALLELALTNYALSVAVKHGFTPMTTPDVVRTDVAYRCGFQPRDPDSETPVSQMYHVSNALPQSAGGTTATDGSPELVLAGTAEIPLAGYFADKIFLPQELPKKVVGLGRAFRAEAGARGADTRGLYRVHQFTKLELFVVSTEEQSDGIMEEMRSLQTKIFDGLGLSFRVLDMPTEELGASAYRKYDMEAWMPGRDSWGEISSTSNCTDYQARRLHIRYRSNPAEDDSPANKAATSFAHTLNGTAAAIPRLIVALLENGARFDGEGNIVGVDLPKVLKPFWVGEERDVIRWV